MEVSQELSGVSAEDFNSDPSVGISFTQSVAEAMGISNNSVEITNVTEVSATSSSSGSGSGRRLRLLALSSGSRQLGGSSEVSLQVDYVVTLVMQSLGFQDSDEAVTQMKQSIQDSVSTGEFSEILKTVSKALSVNILANVSASQITIKKVSLAYSSPSPTLRPTSQPSLPHTDKKSSSDPHALSGGGLIGVIVAGGVILCLLAGLLHFFTSPQTKEVVDVSVVKSGPGFELVLGEDEAVNLGVDPSASPPPPVGGGHELVAQDDHDEQFARL
jgi:hypothetical protein